MNCRIIQGDALSALRLLEPESVQVCVTSPPYFGLRSYGTNPQTWGGDLDHAHEWGTVPSPGSRSSDTNPGPLQHPGNKNRERLTSDLCACGAWRGELGLEPTPALFIEHLVAVFDEVKRVMRPDAVLFVNIGDSYWTRSAMRQGGNREQIKATAGEIEMPSWQEHAAMGRTRYSSGHPRLKDKDLTLIPERFAIAMQDAGWYVRQQIVWSKASCMPESVKDRFTSAWEPIWMFAKSRIYYFDQEAVRLGYARERQPEANHWTRNGADLLTGQDRNGTSQNGMAAYSTDGKTGANRRNVWHLGPEPSREAHYAAFPTAIPRICIQAGTSEKGACPACGAPWRRVVERTAMVVREGPGRSGLQPASLNATSRTAITGTMLAPASSETLGWQPGCRCENAGPPVPQTVLDPFLGSGTTALVADQLGRHAIGIELSPKYVEIAKRRLENDAPMVSDPVTVEAPTQASLFVD